MNETQLPHNTIERLFVYRRALQDTLSDGKSNIFSHELGNVCGASSEQVRRDLMLVGAEGNRRTGYDCLKLLCELNSFFKIESDVRMVVVGVGNLGRAVLSYFMGKQPHLRVVAAFDNDSSKVNRVIHGCHCYAIDDLESTLEGILVHVGVIAVPDNYAQDVAEKLVRAKVKTILNFAPVRLRIPSEIHVENMDVTLSVEKLGFFAKISKS